MRLSHILLAILLMTTWGFGYIAIAEGLRDMPPLLLCSLRFLLTSIPAVFFIKKPDIPWIIIIAYGLFMFVFTFSLIFLSLYSGMIPGLASLLMQLQAFFTILLALIFFKEKLNPWQIIGAVVSFGGLIVVGLHIGGDVTIMGLICIIGAAFSWSIGNLVSKKAHQAHPVGLIVWGSLVTGPVLLCFSIIFEGSRTIIHSLHHISLLSSISLIYMAYPVTLLGYSLWSWLLNRYRAATVTPFSLLVPCFGIVSAMIIFKEALEPWKLTAIALIMGGLCINVFGIHVVALYRLLTHPKFYRKHAK